MTHGPSVVGPGVTRAGDRRVTSLGRLLRKWKIDELPQLVNVIRGEMSLVGPRPDLAEYFRNLKLRHLQVLLLKPGITSPATIAFRNEEAVLASVPEPQLDDFYCRVLLPQKLELELAYAEKATLATDLKVILDTATAVLFHD